ncbi:Uncharacterized protein TCM_041454 [Theobroma cacao]|uniref:Uncharacterized protein n=1 Tax=Theobroma cacao TaxID=3641 RepID=A0A061GVN0_THECC|nr:Uncharacterized protein TCM_041454 [Theobroma cacao]
MVVHHQKLISLLHTSLSQTIRKGVSRLGSVHYRPLLYPSFHIVDEAHNSSQPLGALFWSIAPQHRIAKIRSTTMPWV